MLDASLAAPHLATWSGLEPPAAIPALLRTIVTNPDSARITRRFRRFLSRDLNDWYRGLMAPARQWSFAGCDAVSTTAIAYLGTLWAEGVVVPVDVRTAQDFATRIAAQTRPTLVLTTGPTRAALLSGYYPQQIRMDPPRGLLPEWTRLLPHYLKPMGYRSYHSGKWHVNGAPRPLADGGFDRSYRLEDHNRHFYPSNHWLDDERLPPVPRGGKYYSTVAIADFMVQCLREHAEKFSGQPFFGYLAFTAPHFPLQALPGDIARYRDKYLEGWDVVLRRRFERQLKMGLVRCALSRREPETVPYWNLKDAELKEQISPGEVARAVAWSELSDGERRFQARKMAIHAAMIDRMDREIGRVLRQLKAMGALENTLVMFASDNGASAEFLNRGDKHDPSAGPGSGGSFLCLGPGWSTVGNTPFRLHKSWVHEGGISTPLLAHWPRGIAAKGELRHAVAHVIDIVPTVLELVGAKPDKTWNGVEPPPFPGRSLVPAFARDVPVDRSRRPTPAVPAGTSSGLPQNFPSPRSPTRDGPARWCGRTQARACSRTRPRAPSPRRPRTPFGPSMETLI